MCTTLTNPISGASLVNGGYGGVVVVYFISCEDLTCAVRQSLHKNVLTKKFHCEGIKKKCEMPVAIYFGNSGPPWAGLLDCRRQTTTFFKALSHYIRLQRIGSLMDF